MQAKLIEYAYPSSTTATKAGYGKTGCWFVALYASVTSWNKVKTLGYFAQQHEAKTYADNLPNEYHQGHKYFSEIIS